MKLDVMSAYALWNPFGGLYFALLFLPWLIHNSISLQIMTVEIRTARVLIEGTHFLSCIENLLYREMSWKQHVSISS